MTTQVRETTRQAWKALQDGGPPSVRQVYRLAGGSYNVVAAECRALRAETGPPRPVPCVVPPGIRAALASVVQEIRTNPTYAHNLKVRLSVMEHGEGGPLAHLVDTIAQQDVL